MKQTEHSTDKKYFNDFIYDVQEELCDLKNILQLLEIALEENEDDNQIARTIQILNKMISALIDKNNVFLGLNNDSNNTTTYPANI